MSYETALNEEIDAIIEKKVNAKEALHPVWITQEVCAAHQAGLIEGDHKNFWLHSGHLVVRAAVLSCVRRVADTTPERIAQPSLPGFAHMQTHYIVKRDGDELALHVEVLTDAELDAIAARIDGMAETCKAHAREVRRFKRLRRKAA